MCIQKKEKEKGLVCLKSCFFKSKSILYVKKLHFLFTIIIKLSAPDRKKKKLKEEEKQIINIV